MANPGGQIPVNPDAVRAAEERFALMEAELQTLREQNDNLMRELREQQTVAEAERLRADRRTRAQVQDFANLTAELLAGRPVQAANIGGMNMGVKLERPEAFEGAKHQDVDTWLFQVGEHLRMLNIPAPSQVAYAASLLRGNAAMWWRERCEAGVRPADWDAFCATLCAQFRVENLARRGRDELASVQQYARESVADFLFRFRGICLKISDLGEAEKLDRFCRALLPSVRLQVELRGPATFPEAAAYAERADAVLSRVPGQDFGRGWQKQKPQHRGTFPSPQSYKQPPSGSGPGAGTGTGTGSGPEPMEIGSMQRKPLTKEEYQRLRTQKGCFYCRQVNAGHIAKNCPLKLKRQGNSSGR